MSSLALWGCTTFIIFYQAFKFQKRFLKTKHPLLSSNPRILPVCGHRGSWFRPGCGHWHQLTALGAWSCWHQKRDTSKHNCSWPGLPSGSSSLPINDGDSWEQPHLTEVPQMKHQPEAIIQNHTDWDISASLVHTYLDLVHKCHWCHRQDWQSWKGRFKASEFSLVFWHQHLSLILVIVPGCFCFTVCSVIEDQENNCSWTAPIAHLFSPSSLLQDPSTKPIHSGFITPKHQVNHQSQNYRII